MTLRIAHQRAILAIASVLGPVFVLTAYLVVSRWPERWFTTSSDYAALAVALAVGVICVWLVPVRWQWRLAMSIANVAVMSVGLILWTLAFVCSVFQDCL
jgi:hypothetical protein